MRQFVCKQAAVYGIGPIKPLQVFQRSFRRSVLRSQGVIQQRNHLMTESGLDEMRPIKVSFKEFPNAFTPARVEADSSTAK
jgi:hypothetical protein